MIDLRRCIAALIVTSVAACATAETNSEENTGEVEKNPGRAIGTLTTPDYEVTLRSQCAEGEVSCDRIIGRLTKTASEQHITLHGSTLHRLCADGQTPCRFLGYELAGDEYEYRILENGQLTIQRCGELDCEAIYNARGSWQY